ncbi:MAG TPA: endo-1,4-beta-xylanase [Clostridia bacterium]|nr:endo-1,4-beta-xylanase [Clostridia bacterium]
MNSFESAMLQPFEKQRDLMEDRIRWGIEAHRKGYADIRVQNADGVPIPGAHVDICQKSNAFKLGANLFMLDEFKDPAHSAAYRAIFPKLFNYATLPFYWGDLEPEQGNPRFAADSPKVYRRPAPDLCLAYCRENGVTPKGHCLVYEPFRPAWLPREDVPAIKRLYEERIAALGARYAAAIPDWEVTNETLYNTHSFGYTAFFFAEDHVPWSFACARRHFPQNALLINEGQDRVWKDFHGNRSQYYLQIEGLLLKGVPVDGIGMQFHVWAQREEAPQAAALYYDPQRLYDVMDCYGRLGLPLQITEVTVPCYEAGEAMEDLQAEILRNLYRIWFSHGAMEAVVYWNTVDGGAFGNENHYRAGLIRQDLMPKPSFRVLQALFDREWRTQTQTRTDDGGRARFKGFYGDYTLEVTVHGQTKAFSAQLRRDGLRSLTLTL